MYSHYLDSLASVSDKRSRWYTARQVCVCSECHRLIDQDERYVHTAGMWLHGVIHSRLCTDCLSARSVFYFGSNSWHYGCMWSYIYDYLEDWLLSEDMSLGLLDRLSVRARDMCIAHIDKLLVVGSKTRDSSWYDGEEGIDWEWYTVRTTGVLHDGNEYESQWREKRKIEKSR